jgi:quinol monooxygenase YgiN
VIIVGGTFEVDPERRDQFLADRHGVMQASRAEAGCLDYVFSADPLVPDRVLLFERWVNQESLDAHLNRLRSESPSAGGVAPRTVSVIFYDAEAQPPPGA